MIQNDYSRQVNILNPEEFNTRINIIGAGATGSWVAFSLAKMGLQNLHIYDFDTVGMHNLPNQMFGVRDIDRNKAISIRNIIKLFTGFTVRHCRSAGRFADHTGCAVRHAADAGGTGAGNHGIEGGKSYVDRRKIGCAAHTAV